jgi:hypothetical protein
MAPPVKSAPDEYASPWKEALRVYLRPRLEFCFPEAAPAIDWTVLPQFLDREPQEIAPHAALGEQRVDLLVQVQRRNGASECIPLHVEAQHPGQLGDPADAAGHGPAAEVEMGSDAAVL